MPKEKPCDHGYNNGHLDAMRCAAPTSCSAHEHRCRACGMTRPAGTPWPFYVTSRVK